MKDGGAHFQVLTITQERRPPKSSDFLVEPGSRMVSQRLVDYSKSRIYTVPTSFRVTAPCFYPFLFWVALLTVLKLLEYYTCTANVMLGIALAVVAMLQNESEEWAGLCNSLLSYRFYNTSLIGMYFTIERSNS